MEISKKKNIGNFIANSIFLIVLNITLMSIIGFLTIDSAANSNSRIGAILLSFFIPIFIVYQSKEVDGLQRMLKFGFGFIFYLVAASVILGIPTAFVSGLIPCLLISLGILFYGKTVINKFE